MDIAIRSAESQHNKKFVPLRRAYNRILTGDGKTQKKPKSKLAGLPRVPHGRRRGTEEDRKRRRKEAKKRIRTRMKKGMHNYEHFIRNPIITNKKQIKQKLLSVGREIRLDQLLLSMDYILERCLPELSIRFSNQTDANYMFKLLLDRIAERRLAVNKCLREIQSGIITPKNTSNPSRDVVHSLQMIQRDWFKGKKRKGNRLNYE